MADDSERLILGVDATQAPQGVAQFLSAFSGVGPGIESVLRQVERALPPDLFAAKGRQIVEGMYRAMQAAAIGRGDIFGGAGGVGGSLLQSVGLSRQNLQEFDSVANRLSTAFRDIRRAQDLIQPTRRAFAQAGFLVPGLPDEGAVRRTVDALGVYRRAVVAAQRAWEMSQPAVGATGRRFDPNTLSMIGGPTPFPVDRGFPEDARRFDIYSSPNLAGRAYEAWWNSAQVTRRLDENQARLNDAIRQRVQANIEISRAERQAAAALPPTAAQQRGLAWQDPRQRQQQMYDELFGAGGGGGFRAGFIQGWSGGPDGGRPWSEMMGQTARIALSYGVAYRALSALQDSIVAITQATIAYDAALTDLEIVTGRSREQNRAFAADLADLATGAGFQAGQGVEVGWRALGLLGVASAPQDVQEQAARTSAEVALRIARVSGAEPVAVQTQVVGALRSFDWGVDRLTELEDAITFVSRQTGQASTELVAASSNLATLAGAAGFSPQQLLALVAQVATTTGQDPNASAGQFRQVLSREARVIGPRTQEIFGIDTTGLDIAGIFAAVSQLDATQEQLNEFANLFGKGGSTTVALRLVQDWERINQLAQGAADAEGLGREAFDRAMLNIGNQVRELGASFTQMGADLAGSGIVDWFAVLLAGAQNVVGVGTDVLGFFNQLPRPLRTVAFALGEIYLASNLIARTNVGGRIGAIATAIQGLFRATAAGRGGAALAGLGSQVFGRGGILRLSEVARADLLSAPAGQVSRWNQLQARTGLTGTGLVLSAAAVAAIAAGIGDGIARVMEARDVVDALRPRVAGAATESELRNVAAAAREAAVQIREAGLAGLAPGNLYELLPRAIASLTTGGEQDQARALAAQAEARADELAQAQAQLEAASASRVFTDFSSEGLEATLAELEDRGYTAAERLDLLNQALFRFTTEASGVRDAIAAITAAEAPGVAQGFGAEFQRQALSLGPERWRLQREARGTPLWVLGDQELLDASRLADLAGPVESALPDITTEVRTLFEEQLREFASDGVITQDEADRMGAELESALPDIVGPELWGRLDAAGVAEDLRIALLSGLQRTLGDFSAEVSQENIGDFLRNLPAFGAAVAEGEVGASGSAQRGARAQLAYLESSRAQALRVIQRLQGEGDDVAQYMRLLRFVDFEIAAVRRQIAEQRAEEIRSLAAYEQALLPSDDVLGRLAVEARSIAQQQAALASQADPRRYLTPTGPGGIAPSAYTPEQLAQMRSLLAQQAQNEEQIRQARLAFANAQTQASVAANDTLGQARAQITVAQRNYQAATQGTTAQLEAQIALGQAQNAYRQLVVQAANNAALAATDPRDTVGRARVAMQNAARTMGASGRGSPEYYSALEQYRAAQLEVAQAQVRLANAQASAGIAGGESGLRQAQVAVANAQRTLSTQLGGTQGYYDALAQLRQAQLALAAQERQQADRQRRLASDLTDPVQQAALDTQAALDALRAAQARGDGPDVIAQAQIDLRNAQARQEAEAFRQRISDLQTAEDLGRISHSQYMAYLQAEHDRLSAIAQRTRQQQDQLDEVERLMQAAAEELQGQFNIGDIELPTVYEVRRAMQSGAPTQIADYSNSHNVVTINGADFGRLVEYLESLLGPNAQMVVAGGVG